MFRNMASIQLANWFVNENNNYGKIKILAIYNLIGSVQILDAKIRFATRCWLSQEVLMLKNAL